MTSTSVARRHALASCRRGRYNALQIGEVLPLFAVLRSSWKRHNGPAGRGRVRAELDGLTEEDFAYILPTFPLVGAPAKVAAHNASRDVVGGW